jgi:hypothetical protein
MLYFLDKGLQKRVINLDNYLEVSYTLFYSQSR